MIDISEDEAYLLGLLYGKGTINSVDNNKIVLRFRVKFRRPTDLSVRSDNIHTKNDSREYLESLKSKLSNDFSNVMELLRRTWNINSTIDLPNSYDINSWDMKEIIITTEKIDNNHSRLSKLFNVDTINDFTLNTYPYHLNLEVSKVLSLSFIQGFCDACSLVPSEASSSYGGSGKCRIQLEPSQERWDIPIGLCRLFQIGLKIPVANINWGHPQTRTTWRHQNHQFRVYLENIPPEIELYRLGYKREEYVNLYRRRNVVYEKGKLCPYSKRVRIGETLYINKTQNEDLNSDLLDSRIRGLNIQNSGKNAVIICKLLGCKQCENYFDVKIADTSLKVADDNNEYTASQEESNIDNNEYDEELIGKINSLIEGKIVYHKKFGKGKIISINNEEGYLIIDFNNSNKKFEYPNAFLENHLQII